MHMNRWERRDEKGSEKYKTGSIIHTKFDQSYNELSQGNSTSHQTQHEQATI